MKTILFALTILLYPAALHAQKNQAKSDSLFRAYQKATHDSSRAKALNALASETLQNGNADSALKLATSAQTLSAKAGFTIGEAEAYIVTGQALAAKANQQQATKSYEAALNLYKQARDAKGASEANYALGIVHQRSNYSQALKYFTQALDFAQQTTNKDQVGKSAYMVAVTLLRQGDYNEAGSYTNIAIKSYTEAGNQTGLANCYVASSRINQRRGNIEQSLKDNYAALRLFEQTKNQTGIYNVYTGLGSLYLDQKNYPEALNSYLASKKAAAAQGSKLLLWGAGNNVGNTYLEMGNTTEAQQAFEEALGLAQQANDKKGVATVQGNLGIIYSRTGKPTEAIKSFEQTIDIYQQLGAREGVSIAYLEISKVYLAEGRPAESRQWADKALQLAREVDYKDVISRSYLALSQIDTATGDYASAFNHYKRYIIYRDSITNAEAARQLVEQRLQYTFSQKEDSLRMQQAIIAAQLEKQTLLTKQQQQELRLQQASLELTKREKDVQMLSFLKTKAELQLSNEQQEKQLAMAEQEKLLQQSRLERQTMLSAQKEQALLIKDKELTVQRSQRDFWLIGAIALFLLSFFIFRSNRQKQRANVDLQRQKGETEKAMSELKATQAQLVQREKMASLGELTAGIAHEIQNPLNFVNNFSALNKELLAEMYEEMLKGNYEEAKVLAAGIEENEQKVLHHGQRADAIVKSMLEHSRGTTGEKQSTDINSLADEYLQLAYHGMRGRDSNFNVRLNSAYGNDVGMVRVVPQDIGRVLLNLFSNAFYAVGEKKKKLNGLYQPEVTVNTRRNGGYVEILVKDNGNGIPPKALDKIFQPFYTTKPTGEGTGLGLSLSYDIVTKGHGGDLNVDTKEGEYTAFVIQLPV